MMKKLLYLFLGTMLMLGLSSCGDIVDVNDDFDASLLYGRWQEGTVYERYYDTPFEHVLATGDTVLVNGTTWDTSDDVSEDEAQVFKWTLEGSTLTHEHQGQGFIVPKVYTITTLNSSQLTYHDAYGTTHYYSKVD